MKTDVLVLHNSALRDTIGDFHGTPIKEVDILAAELRELGDLQQNVRHFMGTDFLPVELLPGEVIKDNVIRRFTTAEVRGEKFYADADIPNGKQVPVEEAAEGAVVTWRPNNQNFAVIHEEVPSELSV